MSIRPVTLILALVLLAGPVTALPLTLPEGAVQIGTRVDDPAQYSLATAAFDGTRIPARIVTGSLQQSAWRLDGIKGNTLSLLQPLTDQLTAQGYRVVFACETTRCGGFDFRFGLDVLPEPQMHVDLGDFHYVAAMNEAGDAVSLLASRAAGSGFVQVTSVSVSANPAPTILPDPSSAAATPPPGPETLPEPAPPFAGAEAAREFVPMQQFQAASPSGADDSLGARLLAQGSVPLDDLIFASGKAALQDQDYASLAALSAWLSAEPEMRVTLVGHTDASGTLAGNVSLSRQRAASVRDWLVQRYGARPSQIDAQGAGYLSPRATNQTPEGRTLNRRVEVMLTSLPPK